MSRLLQLKLENKQNQTRDVSLLTTKIQQQQCQITVNHLPPNKLKGKDEVEKLKFELV